MATKPQSNLPPQAQPWGRYVEESIATLERGNSINGQNSNNNLRQLNSSVQLLSQQQQDLQAQQTELVAQQNELEAQQAYLATFRTYQSSYPGFIYSGTLSGSNWTRVLDFTLTFTLTRTCVVQIETNAESQVSDSQASTYPQPGSAVRASFSISPGTTYFGNSNSNSVYLGSQNSIQLVTGFTVTPSVQRTLTLAAGTYTVTGFWDGYARTAGYCGVGRAFITASVIG